MKKRASDQIALIFASNKVGTIGHENGIPWKIEGDLPRFKRLTSGNTVVMGRMTFESLGSKPLPNRVNIVISTTLNPQPGILIARTVEQAVQVYKLFGQGTLFVIGGAKIYEQFFDKAGRIFMTVVENTFEGDTRYAAPLNEEIWKVSSVQTVNHADGSLSHTYLNLARR